MLAQLVIPIWVLALNGVRKSRDRKAGNTQSDSPINNKAWTLPVVLTSNSLDNQFQFPIVFYVLCLMLVNLESVTMVSLSLAWVYVITRWVHAVVHVTTNAIPFRFGFFVLSSLTLLVLFAYTVRAVLLVS
jgi:hypothetical protein